MADDRERDTYQRVVAGIEAHEAGDHRRAAEVLGPVVDDPIRWSYVPQSKVDPVDVAYAAGTSRIFAGDLDGAARALRMGTGRGPGAERVRRALAQVELSRGDLAAAEQLLDASPRADLMDRALVVTLRWRQGAGDEARARACELVQAKPRRQRRGQHPWTVAGVLTQAAIVLADQGDVVTLRHAVERIGELVRGAPNDLPLVWQWHVLAASALRQEGNLAGAAELLDRAAPHVDPGTCDLGSLELERARLARAAGDAAAAAAEYDRAVATFTAAGERWLADRTRAEADAG